MPRWPLALVILLAPLYGCSDTDPTGDAGDEAETSTSDSSESEESGDTTSETGDETGEPPFQEIYDAGLTEHLGTIEPSDIIEEDGSSTHYLFDPADGPMCLRGDDYWMSTRAGTHDSNDLLIFLQGGGACWSDFCQALEQLGSPTLPQSGMLNTSLAGNAFADWNTVYLPYCDGSLFVGDVDIDDDEDGVIDRYHHGLINLSAALDVAVEEFPDAERIVLAGSSAGSYGVHLSNMLVRYLWPDAELIVIADAGVGLGKPGDLEFVPGLLGEWNALRFFPQSCPECIDDHIVGFVDWQLQRDPNMRFAAISSYGDTVIGDIFLGIGAQAYEAALVQELGWLAEQHPDRYDRFFFAGTLHTTIAADTQSGGGIPGLTSTYDGTVVDGMSVAQWLGLLVNQDPSFDDVIE